MDLNNILLRIKDGEQKAYSEVIQEFGPMIRVYLCGHLKDFRDVEELSQEIFVAAYWNLESFDPERSFAVWLKAIARNKLMSYFRRHYSQKNMANELRAELIDNLPEPDLAPKHDTADIIQQLSDCIAKQKGSAARLIQARYFERESVMDIATHQETTEDAISSRLYRIRQQLKRCIEGGLTS